ncbi:hypothetical protein B566_EDAN007125, partial [Ephemera danica]
MVKKNPEIRIATVEMERGGRGPESEMATLPASNRGSQRGIGGSEETPEKHNVSNREVEERQESPPKRTSLFIVMSFIYAKLLVVVCIAFQISEVVTHNVPLHYYEVFFTYLYGASILYLLYVFCYLLTGNGRPERRPPPKKKKKQKEEKEQPTQGQKNKSGFFQQESYPRKKKHQNRPPHPPRVSSPIPVSPQPPNTPGLTGVGVDERQSEGKDVEGGGVQSGTGTGGTSPLQEKLTGSSHELVQRPRKRKTSENDHGHGSFFLRVGAI